jgi:hypothetical protein
MEQYHTDQNHRVLRELQSLSEETGLKLSQLSLAWLLANPAVTAPIIGASRIQQLEENVDVVDHALSPNALQRMNDVSKPDWLQREDAQQATSVSPTGSSEKMPNKRGCKASSNNVSNTGANVVLPNPPPKRHHSNVVYGEHLSP